jgi:hypothetical protein
MSILQLICVTRLYNFICISNIYFQSIHLILGWKLHIYFVIFADLYILDINNLVDFITKLLLTKVFEQLVQKISIRCLKYIYINSRMSIMRIALFFFHQVLSLWVFFARFFIMRPFIACKN